MTRKSIFSEKRRGKYKLKIIFWYARDCHCAKSVHIWNFSGPNSGKYGPGKLRLRTLFKQCVVKNGDKNLRNIQITLKKNSPLTGANYFCRSFIHLFICLYVTRLKIKLREKQQKMKGKTNQKLIKVNSNFKFN